MTEPQDFESLDELFRKTFDQLPENAAPSGWDRPSDRVWQHIQTTVQPPSSGWSAKAITLVSALAVTIVVGLYLFVTRPVPVVEMPAQPEQTVAAAPVVPQPAAAPEVIVPTPSPVTATNAPRHHTTVRQIRPASSTVSTPAPAVTVVPQRPAGSLPIPGSDAISPNTTVDRQRLEDLRMDPLQPLPVLPEKIDRQILD